jgi:hypothetical protein
MKNLKLAALAITLVGIFGTGNALAADTATLDVTATVIETCRFDSDGGVIDFGNIDALNPVDILAEPADANPSFICSAGTDYTITDDSNTTPMDNGTDTITYALNYINTGTATGLPEELVVTADLLGVDYAGVSAGAYSATVTFTINP